MINIPQMYQCFNSGNYQKTIKNCKDCIFLEMEIPISFQVVVKNTMHRKIHFKLCRIMIPHSKELQKEIIIKIELKDNQNHIWIIIKAIQEKIVKSIAIKRNLVL